MAIGTASRLEALRIFSTGDSGQHGRDASSRSHWSVYILERTFSPQLCTLPEPQETVDYLHSAPMPPRLPSGQNGNYHSDLEDSGDIANDLGINVYYIKFLSVWERLSCYLHGIRMGKIEIPWLQDSTHALIHAKLH